MKAQNSNSIYVPNIFIERNHEKESQNTISILTFIVQHNKIESLLVTKVCNLYYKHYILWIFMMEHLPNIKFQAVKKLSPQQLTLQRHLTFH